jgi:peptidoglycan/xylan/chitin deacetylase (PgdA/CDA1 family)
LYAYKSVSDFAADLEFLLKHYSPITLADLVDHVRVGRRLPRRSILLTFDDGFREMSDTVAPLLTAKGVSATFFVNSAFIDNRQMCYLNKASLVIDELARRQQRSLNHSVAAVLRCNGINDADSRAGILSLTYGQRHVVDELGRVAGVDFDEYLAETRPYLTSGQIAGLIRNGFGIGAHSVDHPLYSAMSLDEQLGQTVASLASIRQAFGLDYGAFAFPHSDRHVSRCFFERLSETELLDLSFGTSGMVDDSVPTHFQRFSLEAPLEAAERIVAFQLARRLGKQFRGDARIDRH